MTSGAIALLTTLIIGEVLLLPSVLANPSLEKIIAQRINTLKSSDHSWIEIDISNQYLFAWKGNNQIFTTIISTGKLETPTHPGIYTIQRKYLTDRMRGENYDIADVPHVLYFDRGYALHGAYWHDNFGTPVSHGCVNLSLNDAQWLFNWTTIGTPVVIHQ